jgi:hypothetical protein
VPLPCPPAAVAVTHRACTLTLATQGLAQLLSASQRQVTALQLQELHELDGFDTLDAASLWDVLAAAAPALRGRLAALSVSGCFWNQPESFGVLRQLTALTELRCAVLGCWRVMLSGRAASLATPAPSQLPLTHLLPPLTHPPGWPTRPWRQRMSCAAWPA